MIAHRKQGSGPPLVVINGLAATGEDWDPAFTAGLAAENELFLVDNRGIGASPDDGSGFEIADLAADCAELIVKHAGGPTVILGWSMGGFIAQALALARPELVTKLVLLSTDPGGRNAQPSDPDVITQLIDTSPPPDEQARRLLALLFDAQTAETLYQQVGDVVADARSRLDQSVLDRQRAALDAWHHAGAGDRLAELPVPTLIATGTADRVIPPTNSLLLTERIRDSWLLRFRGGGHGFMAQYPETLSRMINAFIAL